MSISKEPCEGQKNKIGAVKVLLLCIFFGAVLTKWKELQANEVEAPLIENPKEETAGEETVRPVRMPLDMTQMSWKTYWHLMVFSNYGLVPIILVSVHLFMVACVMFMVRRHQRLAHLYELP